ncbi:MAG: CHAD domain-containing protein [Saprospiraceae bacterium]
MQQQDLHTQFLQSLNTCKKHTGKKEVHALRLAIYLIKMVEKVNGRKVPKRYKRLYKKLGNVRDLQKSASMLKKYIVPRQMEKELEKRIKATRKKLEKYFDRLDDKSFANYDDDLVKVSAPSAKNVIGTYRQYSLELLQHLKIARDDNASWHDLRKKMKHIYKLESIPGFAGVYYSAETMDMLRSWSSLLGVYHDYQQLEKNLEEGENEKDVKKLKK